MKQAMNTKGPKRYAIIKDFASTNGGTNNLHVARVMDGLQIIKSFTSKKSIDRATTYAEKYVTKSLNGLPHYTN